MDLQPHAHEFAYAHVLHSCLKSRHHFGAAEVCRACDESRACVYDALSHVKDRHHDVERVGEDVNGDERLENPLVDVEGVEVLKVVFLDY